MKIRLRHFLINVIYILIYISAFSQLRYQLTLQRGWHHLFLISLYSIILIDIFYMMMSIQYILKYAFGIVAFLLLFIAYEILVSIFSNMIYLGAMVRDIFPWPLTFIVIYLHVRRYGIPASYKAITTAGLLICCVLSVPNISRHLVDYGRRGGVIFPLYYCISFLGTALRLCDKKTRYILLLIVAALLVVSTKRAGTAIVFSGIVLYFISDTHIQGSVKAKANRIITYSILVIAATYFGYALINRYEISILERFSRVLDDGGSNRKYIWQDVMEHYHQSPVLNKIFGHGFHAVYYKVQPYGYPRMAHNSYMETLYDYGIVGLIFVVLFSMYLILNTLKMYIRKSPNLPAMMYSMAELLILGVFSYLFEESIIIMACIVNWAICIGDEHRMLMMNSVYRRPN